jgi:polar amino acid transport system substrate-binding protein
MTHAGARHALVAAAWRSMVRSAWLLLWLPANAQPPLLVVTEPWPPYNTFSNDETADGAHALIVQRALAHSGLTASISVYPWARAMALTETRPNTLLFSLARTAEREDRFIWLGRLSQTQQFLWHLDSPGAANLSLQQIMHCCSICTVRKDVSEETLRQQDSDNRLQLVLTGSHHDCLRMLRSGSVQYMAGSAYRIQATLLYAGLQGSLLQRATAIAPPRILYLAANKGTPAGTVRKIQAAMQQLQDSGESERILQQVLSRPLPSGTDKAPTAP